MSDHEIPPEAWEALWRRIEALLDELIACQEARAVAFAGRLHPGATGDDIRQPHDLPALAENPEFQFEEGQIAGLTSAKIALRARIYHQREKG